MPIKDPDPPEIFEPVLARNPNVFDNKWFLVFVSQDKGSGIAYYAIRETRREINIQRETDAKWVEAESPYLLEDQELRSFAYVKAVDKAGNERVAMVKPRFPLKWYQNDFVWFIIIVGMFVIYLAKRILWKK